MTAHATDDERPLETSAAQLRELVNAATDRLASFLDRLAEQPAWDDESAVAAARSAIEPLPRTGRPVEQVFARLFDELIPPGVNAASPGYLAYVPGGGLPDAAVADLIAGVVNRYIGIWSGAPGLAQLEATVLHWFGSLLGLPPTAGGFFTSGGSLSIWAAVATARICRAPNNLDRATVYTSDQAHHSVQRAARLAGLPLENVRDVAVDASYRLDLDDLVRQLQRDRAAGWRPLLIVGQGGTTNTGAVDDLHALADVAEHDAIWLHVDAAYGGFFALTERGRQRLAGIERADSITLDPHKSLFLPYGTGCLLVRDRQHLLAAHQMRGAYMTSMQTDPDFVDFCDVSPELTRACRGLRVWLPMQLHGSEAFRRQLDEKLDLAVFAASELRALAAELSLPLELVEPQLSILAFRFLPVGLDDRATDAWNRNLRDRINHTRRVFLTPTLLRERYVIRLCILSFRTHHEHLRACLHEIRRACGEMTGNVVPV